MRCSLALPRLWVRVALLGTAAAAVSEPSLPCSLLGLDVRTRLSFRSSAAGCVLQSSVRVPGSHFLPFRCSGALGSTPGSALCSTEQLSHSLLPEERAFPRWYHFSISCRKTARVSLFSSFKACLQNKGPFSHESWRAVFTHALE